jgi:hypothetical protein
MLDKITLLTAQTIIKYGKLYNPAISHYPNLINNKIDTGVTCNYCNKPNLKLCIGLNDNDLCLTCVDAISNIYPERQSNRDRTVNTCLEDFFPKITK